MVTSKLYLILIYYDVLSLILPK